MNNLLTLLFALFLTLSIGCSENPLQSTNEVGNASSQIQLKAKTFQNLGDVEATYVVRNISLMEPIVFGFGTGCQLDFAVFKDGKEVFNNDFKFCTLALTQINLLPGQKKVMPFKLTISDQFEELGAGNYRLIAELADDNGLPVSIDFVVE